MENESGTTGNLTSGPIEATPAQEPLSPMQKLGLIQAIAQLDMLSQVFPNAPKRVQDAHREFIASLKEWCGPDAG
jgi:hypothetical protein